MKRGISALLAAAAAVVLASCQTVDSPHTRSVWTRADGRIIANDAALARQYELDNTACEGAVAKANMGANKFCRGAFDCLGDEIGRIGDREVVRKGCMAEKGYVQRPAIVNPETGAMTLAQQ